MSYWGCIGAHGAFSFYNSGFLVAYGYRVIVEEDAAGRVLGGFDTGLANSHWSDFALDRSANLL